MNEGSPTYKVAAASIAAAVGAILIWLVEHYGGVDLPPPVEAAIVVVLTFVAGYVVPEHNPSRSARRHVLHSVGHEEVAP
jgi:uncharacterized membrane protein